MLSLLPVVLNRIKSLYKLTIIRVLTFHMDDISEVIKNINKIYIQTEMFSTFNTATEIWDGYAVQGRL